MSEHSLKPVTLLITTFAATYVLQRVANGWKAAKSVRDWPGPRSLLSDGSILGNALPPILYVAPGMNSHFINKFDLFQQYDCDVIARVSYWPKAGATIHIANAETLKLASWARQRFPKDIEVYAALQIFGNNIVASEYDEWKFHRRIAAPAFSDRNNNLVWAKTVDTVNGLMSDVWKNEKEVHVDNLLDLALSSALFVIGGAAFGRTISWLDEETVAPGHKMSFKDAMVCVSTDVTIYMISPNWMPGFTEKIRRVRMAFDELEIYMTEMVEERRIGKMERFDLLTRLLEENDHDEDAMSMRGILSNIFMFMVAGHETLAHTLCFAFALLALYPDEQDKLYGHIKSVLPKDGTLPTFDDMSKYTQTMAVFNETLRMFPPVTTIPKVSAEDQVVGGTRLSDGSKVTVPCPVGTMVGFSIAGLHYNPRYWQSPHEFRPNRFLGDWPRDAFLPFAAGPRACLGRKFAETEGIAIITLLVAKYRVEIKEEPEFSCESFDQRRERVLRTTGGLTLTPVRVPLTFRRRD
ncbi:cytochrome P450 [Schizophyllum amplum]|uniref:Cytochrome P450 n=1 Tax=Schizophyllum amplum TaxID=97359 RepID=A0A550CWZ5_9AGAR|nr:cytochrome P450 [Auriculariopsis ampla]